ncbi:YadA C-terminal domain-containing protein [Candidatus Symbiopectobacterium sp. NZEC127]|uniref:YadA C-terminal domain-containing protein n=1 Tax=Candidatus Symbiopectobacterium sp. NZEC127 TaxID=2820472 RepID=UPI0022276377|nr:YadA C-terminal domain-containing protein [Candidatus Symbiopectobacterium sp. NZEC127]MCW2487558.1 YadA C-terminal domain-containing protein [Candidatus Symbiopectobacterium sp. NZEC127]
MKQTCSRSILAVIISAVCVPAFAGLSGADKQAADAYFATANHQLSENHPENATLSAATPATQTQTNVERLQAQIDARLATEGGVKKYVSGALVPVEGKIAAAQNRADQALSQAGVNTGRIDRLDVAINTNATNIDKVQTTADRAQTTADQAKSSAIHANNNANIALKNTVNLSSHVASLETDVATVKDDVAANTNVNEQQQHLITANSEAIAQVHVQNSERVQNMLHARQQAETQATVKAAVDAIPHAEPADDHSKAITANRSAIKATNNSVRKLAKQQQIESIYYSEQIQTLADNTTQSLTEEHSAIKATHARAVDNSQQIDDLNGNVSHLRNLVEENKKEAAAGSSAAMAQANIPQVLNGQTVAIGAGIGGYDGESAVAVGVSFRATQNVTVKATVSDDTQENLGYGAGLSVGW